MRCRRHLRDWILPLAALGALAASSLVGMRSAYRTRLVEARTLGDFATLAASLHAQRTYAMLANAAVPVMTAVGKRGERSPERDLVHLEAAVDSLRSCCPVGLVANAVASGLWGDTSSVRFRARTTLSDSAHAERLATLRRIAAWDSIGGVFVRFAASGAVHAPSLFVIYPQYDRARAPVGFVAADIDLRAAADSMFGALFVRGPLLLPAAMAGVRSNSELAELTISDREGRVVYQSARGERSPYNATVDLGHQGDLRVTVALTTTAVRGLLRGAMPGQGAGTQIALSLLALALAIVIAVTLRRAQTLSRLRTEFATSVTHELRTPLTQILLNAETLDLQRERSSEERSAFVAAIVRETRRLVRLVDNVLHFSRAERRLLRVRPERLRLDELVRRAVSDRAALAEPGGAVVSVVAGEPIWADVDPDALQLVLANLFDNAVRHGGGTPVRVTVRASASGAEILVEDGGPGITPHDRRRVFEPFVRLDAAYARHPTGTGIGLAVVAEVVRAMEAHVALEEAAPRGVLVRLTLTSNRTGASA